MKIQFYYPTAVAKAEPLNNRFFYTDKSYITINNKKTYRFDTLFVKLLHFLTSWVLIPIYNLYQKISQSQNKSY